MDADGCYMMGMSEVAEATKPWAPEGKRTLLDDDVRCRGLRAAASAETLASESDVGCLSKAQTSISTDLWSYGRFTPQRTPLHGEGEPLLSEAAPREHFSEPSQTMIFLDWDDTLFPSTGLFRYHRIPPWQSSLWSIPPLSEELEKNLDMWRKALQEYVYTACALSDHCVIVTNASRTWVEICVRRFAPDLLPLFCGKSGGLRVVYAGEVLRKQRRAGHGGRGSGCLTWAWRLLEEKCAQHAAASSREAQIAELTAAKLAAMRQEAEAFHADRPDQAWENVISIGDMCYEHDAVTQLGPHVRRTKALTLPTASSLTELTLRLRLFQMLLPVFVRFNGNIDLDLNKTAATLPAIAQAVCISQLGVVQFPDCSSQGPEATFDEQDAEDALDEVAMVVQDWFSEGAGP
jgi:hypothetical protein